MKIREIILIVFIILFAAASLAGNIRFKRGTTPPVSGDKGEPLWQTTGGYNGKGQLWIGYSTAAGRTAYKAYSSYSGKDGYTPVFGTDYFDGATVQPLFCNLSGGQVSYQYDASGVLMGPTSTPVSVRLWLGNSRVIPIHYKWNAAGIVFGNRTGAKFTPTVQTNHLTTSSLIAAQAAYSTNIGYGGKRWCTTTTPVAHSRIGAQGIPGTDATVTEAAVIAAFAAAQTASSFDLIASANTDQKFKIYNASNAKSMYIDGLGNQYWLTTTGEVAVKVLASGSFFIFKNSIKRFEIEDDGGFKQWLPNGSIGFRCYSSGVCYGSEGLPTSNGLCTTRDMTTGVTSYISCGSSGGSETQATILAKIRESTDANQNLERKAAVADSYSSAMIRVRGSNNAWRMRVDTKGQIGVYRNGRRIFGVMTTSGGSVVVGG